MLHVLFSLFLGEDEKERKKRLKAEEAIKKWEDQKETETTRSKQLYGQVS